MSFLDLETYVCNVMVNRPELAGPVDPSAISRPWFRPALIRVHQQLQQPNFSTRRGYTEKLFDGNWRGMDKDTTGNDPVYTSADIAGIAYPADYKEMRYVRLVDPKTGKPSRFPLRSVTESDQNKPRGHAIGDWWCGWWEDWQDYDDIGCSGRVKWLDVNGKLALTHTPNVSTPVTLRLEYVAKLVDPTDDFYKMATDDYLTLNYFNLLASMTAGVISQNGFEEERAAMFFEQGETLLRAAAGQERQIRNGGKTDRLYIPPQARERCR